MTAPRLQQLRALTGITQLPASQLDALVGGLASLKTCASLTPHELNDSPLCPHDKFSPASEHTLPPARERLDSCDLLLTALLKGWTEKLLSELQDPIVEERLPLLSPAHRQRITQFLTEKSLPDPVDAGFVAAVNEALADLIPVVLKESRLVASLDGGAAMTVERFRHRFDTLVLELTKGHDPKKVRIVVEE